jgi:hypothetical protein
MRRRSGARVWEGARGRDSVAWDVVAGAAAPGRPPAGRRGLPPHAPASWQGAWMSGRSSAPRRSAWRPDRSWGTRQSPWPCPSASAARNSRTHRSDSHRWPLSPPKVRRSEALRPQGKLCPCTPDVKRRRTTGSAWQKRARLGSLGSHRDALNYRCAAKPTGRRGRATGEAAAQTRCCRSASNHTQYLIPPRDACKPAGTRKVTDQRFRWSEAILWAWLDLNQRPHPYQQIPGTAVRKVISAGSTQP